MGESKKANRKYFIFLPRMLRLEKDCDFSKLKSSVVCEEVVRLLRAAIWGLSSVSWDSPYSGLSKVQQCRNSTNFSEPFSASFAYDIDFFVGFSFHLCAVLCVNNSRNFADISVSFFVANAQNHVIPVTEHFGACCHISHVLFFDRAALRAKKNSIQFQTVIQVGLFNFPSFENILCKFGPRQVKTKKRKIIKVFSLRRIFANRSRVNFTITYANEGVKLSHKNWIFDSWVKVKWIAGWRVATRKLLKKITFSAALLLFWRCDLRIKLIQAGWAERRSCRNFKKFFKI